MKSRCKQCKRFIGNTNCSTGGKVNDAKRGILICDKCMIKITDKIYEMENNK